MVFRRTRKKTDAAEPMGDAHEVPTTDVGEFPPTDTQAAITDARDGIGDIPEQRQKVDRAPVITDGHAGTQFTFDYTKHRAEIRFDRKPDAPVREYMKDNGFHFDREAEAWLHPVHFTTREQDRVHTKRVFYKASEMIREERGIAPASQALNQ